MADMIQTAENMGFVVRKPHRSGDPHSFENPKTNVVIWECVHDCKMRWAAATLEDNHYRRHRYYDTLIEALEAEKSN
jgi:hypothetical protein